MGKFFVVRDGFGLAGQNATFRVVGPGCEETRPVITESCDYVAAGPFDSHEDARQERNRLHLDGCSGQYWTGFSSIPCRHEAHA